MPNELDAKTKRDRQLVALGVLSTGGSFQEAAEAAGVTAETVRRWRRGNSDFSAMLKQRLHAYLDERADLMAGRLAELGHAAVERLARAVDEPGKRGAWAADRILQHVLRLAGRSRTVRHEHSGRVDFATILRRVTEEGPRLEAELGRGELRALGPVDESDGETGT